MRVCSITPYVYNKYQLQQRRFLTYTPIDHSTCMTTRVHANQEYQHTLTGPTIRKNLSRLRNYYGYSETQIVGVFVEVCRFLGELQYELRNTNHVNSKYSHNFIKANIHRVFDNVQILMHLANN